MIRLSKEELMFFKREGYLVKRRVLDADLMARARDRLWEGAAPSQKRDEPDSWVGPFKEEEENEDQMTDLSDYRLKKRLYRECEVDGINIYRFDWTRIAPERGRIPGRAEYGVIAQEVWRTHPHTINRAYKYWRVDYGKLPRRVLNTIWALRAKSKVLDPKEWRN